MLCVVLIPQICVVYLTRFISTSLQILYTCHCLPINMSLSPVYMSLSTCMYTCHCLPIYMSLSPPIQVIVFLYTCHSFRPRIHVFVSLYVIVSLYTCHRLPVYIHWLSIHMSLSPRIHVSVYAKAHNDSQYTH